MSISKSFVKEKGFNGTHRCCSSLQVLCLLCHVYVCVWLFAFNYCCVLSESTYTHQDYLSLGISFERTVDSCTGIMVTVVYLPYAKAIIAGISCLEQLVASMTNPDVLHIIAEYFNQVVQQGV